MSEKEMFVRIFTFTDKLCKIVKPREFIFLAVDGVAPRAKMNQRVEPASRRRDGGPFTPPNEPSALSARRAPTAGTRARALTHGKAGRERSLCVGDWRSARVCRAGNARVGSGRRWSARSSSSRCTRPRATLTATWNSVLNLFERAIETRVSDEDAIESSTNSSAVSLCG